MARRASTAAPRSRAAPPAALPARVPPLGLPGCRAPGGRFSVTVPAFPPSKSNGMRVGTRTARDGSTRGTLYATEQVHAFEGELHKSLRAALSALGYHVEWFLPKGRKKHKAVNPLFGCDIEVNVAVHVYEPYRTNRDTDGVWKVLMDVCKLEGLWVDDVQQGDTWTSRAEHVGELAQEQTRIDFIARPTASWTRNPGGRPVSTHIAKRWLSALTTDATRGAGATRPRKEQGGG